MIDPDAAQTAENDDSQAIESSITNNAQCDPEDACCDGDEQWLATVLDSLSERSHEAKEALRKALMDDEGSMPLLGLELAATENTFSSWAMFAAGCQNLSKPRKKFRQGCPCSIFSSAIAGRLRSVIRQTDVGFRAIIG